MANRFALFVEEDECVPQVAERTVSRKSTVTVSAGAGAPIPDDGWEMAHEPSHTRKRVKGCGPGFPGKPYVAKPHTAATIKPTAPQIASAPAVSVPSATDVSIGDFCDAATEATNLATTLAESFAEMYAILDVDVSHSPEAATILATLAKTRKQLLACARVLDAAGKKLTA